MAALEKSIASKGLPKWPTEFHRRNVDVYFPRFKMNLRLEVTSALRALGCTLPFSRDFADLSGISPGKPFFLETVQHLAWLKVDEDGAEAAGTTAVSSTGGGMDEPDPSKPILFRADHPFLFVIKHRGLIVFMGRLECPLDG